MRASLCRWGVLLGIILGCGLVMDAGRLAAATPANDTKVIRIGALLD